MEVLGMSRKTMTLNLTDAEMATLEALAETKGLTKSALMRQALRLYQSVELRCERGEKLYFESADKTEKSEILVL
jgi:predicted transcriptional regulator